MENFDKVAELPFHGITYIIKISSKDDVLFVEIEQKDNGNIWKNSFTANYIEEISQKTGNFKKFNVFTKMLLSSITKASDAVFLDILTFQDLEMLKARKQKSNAPATSNAGTKNTKRYMILTYSVEYDKVHYPLPLNFEENPDLDALKNTIKRLRIEIDDLKSMPSRTTTQQSGENFFMTQDTVAEANKNSELIILKVENENLKEKIKRLEESSLNANTKRLGAVEHDLVLKSKLELENELDELKKDYVRDIKRMKAKLEETEIQLEKMKENQGKGRNDIGETGQEDLAEQYAYAKKLNSKYQGENEKLVHEVEDFKNIDRKQKARIKQLETELEGALKRATYSRGSNQSGGSPYNRSRGNSPNTTPKRNPSVPLRNYSPVGAKKETPTRGRFGGSPAGSQKSTPTGSQRGTPIRNNVNANTLGGNRTRTDNSPSNSRLNTLSQPLNRKVTPQRTNQREVKKSPQPIRNPSPTNKPATYSPTGPKYSPGNNKFGMRNNTYGAGNLQRKDLENSQRNNSKNSYHTDSGDESGTRGYSSKNQSMNSILSSKRPNNVNNAPTTGQNNVQQMQQKLKENIFDFQQSKTTNTKPIEKPIQHVSLEPQMEMVDFEGR